jgi:putative oxidoreductase
MGTFSPALGFPEHQDTAVPPVETADAKGRKALKLIATAIYDLPIAVASRLAWLAPLVARLTVGWVFVSTGWGKLHNLEKIIDYFTELGIPYAQYQAPFAAASELFFGLLVLVGLATRIAAIPLILVMLVAIRTAQWESIDSPAALFGLVESAYIAMFAWLAIAGPGPISVDGLIARLSRRDDV